MTDADWLKGLGITPTEITPPRQEATAIIDGHAYRVTGVQFSFSDQAARISGELMDAQKVIHQAKIWRDFWFLGCMVFIGLSVLLALGGQL